MNPGIRPTGKSRVPMTRGLLGSPTPIPMPNQTGHAEALSWADRVRKNGGQISDFTFAAISRFCKSADDGDFRSAIYRLNLFAGGNLSGCLVPLYRGPKAGGAVVGNATDTNVNFVNADFQESGRGGGLKGSSSTVKYLNTGLMTDSLPMVVGGLHMSISATGLSTTADSTFMGSFNGGSTGLFCIDDNISTSYGAQGGRSVRIGTYIGGQFPFTKLLTADESHLIGNRDSSASCVLYRSGQSVARNATILATLVQTSYIPFYVFTLNASNAAVTVTSPATARLYSIGTGMDGEQSASFSAAVSDLNTALGR